jgi:hypothetical protein
VSQLKVQKLDAEDVHRPLDIRRRHQQRRRDLLPAHGFGHSRDSIERVQLLLVQDNDGVDVTLALRKVIRQAAADYGDALETFTECRDEFLGEVLQAIANLNIQILQFQIGLVLAHRDFCPVNIRNGFELREVYEICSVAATTMKN